MSRLAVVIVGQEPGLLMHAWDPPRVLTEAQEVERKRIIAKTQSKRAEDETEVLKRYDCLRSLWLDSKGRPCVPQSVFRAALEGGARNSKEGGLVRQNIIVDSTEFTYDAALGGGPDQWGETLQHNAGVKVGMSKINRTRALFPTPWSVRAVLDVFDLDNGRPGVDAEQIAGWLRFAGRAVGVGDWRPQKSGVHGRFTLEAAEWIDG